VLKVEDWAEIRRLHRAEGVPIKEIARRLGVARNTVRAALASDKPPKYERAPKGSVAGAYEQQVRALLREWPTMPAPVIARRIGWPYSDGPLKKLLARVRPEYKGVGPVDRVSYEPGQLTQCDLWFPEPRIPVGAGQERVLPVLVMTLAFSRYLSAVMIPSRQAGDILAGMWQLISGVGKVTRTLLRDRESAIGGTGKVSVPAAAFAGTLATQFRLAPPRDPEFKGMTERNNGYLETSFLPGRLFASPAGFNAQLAGWLEQTANARTVRSVQGRPAGLLETDLAAMTPLPAAAPATGQSWRVRLGRDYYVRAGTCDYSADPRFTGRLVGVTATPDTVRVCCGEHVIASHARSRAKNAVVTGPARKAAAAELRQAFAAGRAARGQARRHADGHPVTLRALPDYGALFGVGFTAPPRKASTR
jgi:transposase